jgi:RNA polymerase sigma-70 factor, ECF subfamily
MPARADEKPDEALVREVALGDEGAVAALYDRYGSILLGLLVRILGSRAEAEDVLQETFLQVWQRAAQFDPERGRAFTWLVTIGRSRAIDRLRSNRTRGRASDVTIDDAQRDAGAVAADDEVIRTERREIVERALGELPGEQREALLLAYLDGMTQTEIASRLGQPLGTVKTRTRSGLLKLRGLLRDSFG